MRARKVFTLLISNDIIKIIKSLEDSGVLIDGVTETVIYEINDHAKGFLGGAVLAPLADSLLIKAISARGIRRIGKEYLDKSF